MALARQGVQGDAEGGSVYQYQYWVLRIDGVPACAWCERVQPAVWAEDPEHWWPRGPHEELPPRSMVAVCQRCSEVTPWGEVAGAPDAKRRAVGPRPAEAVGVLVPFELESVMLS